MNNKGYTLVELMVSMFITAIVVTMIISFMEANSRSYRFVSETMGLQMEAQTVTNQINDIILEADWIEVIDINSIEKAITIYRSTKADVVLLNQSKQQLYLLEDLTLSEAADPSSLTYSEENNLMASNVSEITFSPQEKDRILSRKQICLSVDFTKGPQSIHVERNVKFRNRLVER